jgi:hypothetical protein
MVYKRQRTALACSSCRLRKSRCNGTRPVCDTCVEMGLECVYARPASVAKPHTQGYVSRIEDRLQMVEEMVESFMGHGKRLQESQDVALNRQTHSPRPPLESASFRGGYREQDANSETRHDSNGRIHISRAEEDTVDGMGTITFADESTCGYFGPSSNSAFFGHIAHALASGTGASLQKDQCGRNDGHDNRTFSRPTSPPRMTSTRRKKSSADPYVLPSHAEVSHLVEIFFLNTGMFFPFIHKKNIVDTLAQLDFFNLTGIRSSWLCLLNMILALATSLNSGNDLEIRFREAEADVFFQRAVELSPETFSNTTNLETCQSSIPSTLSWLFRVFDHLWLGNSAISSPNDTVSPRHSAICSDLETARATCASCIPIGSA